MTSMISDQNPDTNLGVRVRISSGAPIALEHHEVREARAARAFASPRPVPVVCPEDISGSSASLLPGRHLILLDQIVPSFRHRNATDKSLVADRTDGEDLIHQLVDLAEP